MWNYNNVQRTVKDLYDWQQTHPTAGRPRYLLSDFTSVVDHVNDFWKDYKHNHIMYDSYFARRYKNFRFYGQNIDDDNPVDEVYTDWINAVTTFLMMNDKKYTELYKIETLNESTSPTGDYHITETKSGTRSIDTEYVSGSRQDSSTDNIGAESGTVIDSTKAYNSSEFLEVGKSVSTTQPRTDTSSISKGQQTDTEDKDYTENHTITTTGTKDNPSENLEKYKEVWSHFSFYSMVFDDICKELLLV